MTEFDPLVTLIEVATEFEARTIVAVLDDSGIEAHVFVLGNLGLPMSLSPGARGVPVQVRASALAAARTALEESLQRGASVDWDSVDVGDEPPFVPRRRTLRSLVRLGAVALLAGGAAAGVALSFGTGPSLTMRTFTITCLITLAVVAVISGLREWNQGLQHAADWSPPSQDGARIAKDARDSMNERRSGDRAS